jgi:hypothetical protein
MMGPHMFFDRIDWFLLRFELKTMNIGWLQWPLQGPKLKLAIPWGILGLFHSLT